MYYNKYLKYKTKYLTLKNQAGGNNINLKINFFINKSIKGSVNYDLSTTMDYDSLTNAIENIFLNTYHQNFKIEYILVKKKHTESYGMNFKFNNTLKDFVDIFGNNFELFVYGNISEENKIIDENFKKVINQLNKLLLYIHENEPDSFNIIILYSYITRNDLSEIINEALQQIPVEIENLFPKFKKFNIILLDKEFGNYSNNYLQPFISLGPSYDESFDKLGLDNISKFVFDPTDQNYCSNDKCIGYLKRYQYNKKNYDVVGEQILDHNKILKKLMDNNLINFYTVQIFSPFYNDQSKDAQYITKIPNLIIKNFAGHVYYP